MKKSTLSFLIFSLIITMSCNSNDKGSIKVINQSGEYKIRDKIFKLKSLSADSVTQRLKIDKLHSIDTGSYRISINFNVSSGMFYNNGILERDIIIKQGKTIDVYMVGGELSGMFATDPEIEVDK